MGAFSGDFVYAIVRYEIILNHKGLTDLASFLSENLCVLGVSVVRLQLITNLKPMLRSYQQARITILCHNISQRIMLYVKRMTR